MLELAKSAYELDTKNIVAWRVYAIALHLSGKEEAYKKLIDEALDERLYEQIIDLLQTEIKNNPQNKDLRLSLANTYLEAFQPNVAISIIEGVRNDFPEFDGQGRVLIEQIKGGKTSLRTHLKINHY